VNSAVESSPEGTVTLSTKSLDVPTKTTIRLSPRLTQKHLVTESLDSPRNGRVPHTLPPLETNGAAPGSNRPKRKKHQSKKTGNESNGEPMVDNSQIESSINGKLKDTESPRERPSSGKMADKESSSKTVRPDSASKSARPDSASQTARSANAPTSVSGESENTPESPADKVASDSTSKSVKPDSVTKTKRPDSAKKEITTDLNRPESARSQKSRERSPERPTSAKSVTFSDAGPDVRHKHKVTATIESRQIPRSRSASSLRETVTEEHEIETIDWDNPAPPSVRFSPRETTISIEDPEISRLDSQTPTGMFEIGNSAKTATVQQPPLMRPITPKHKKPQENGRPSSAPSRPTSATGDHRRFAYSAALTQLTQDNPKLNQTTQRIISTHLRTSIFTIICCGIGFGFAALYFSLKTKQKLKEGELSVCFSTQALGHLGHPMPEACWRGRS